jgi:hypothetical protein
MSLYVELTSPSQIYYSNAIYQRRNRYRLQPIGAGRRY